MSALDLDRWREIGPYLDQALDCAPEAQAAWLAALRAENAALADEIEGLLAEHAALDREGFLAGNPVPPLMRAALAGQILGAYTLESLIGRGGMGNVWLARRSDGRFDGSAAVKLLNVALIGAAGEERFRREGSVLAKLTHPNIARLLDAGTTPSGQAYIVLEHVAGRHIDVYCDECRLSVAARIELFLDVLAAVAHAHKNLIVHRDLKPSNILVTHDGAVKLLDFGVAKLIHDDGSGALPPTRETAHALTPEYAAPEQIAGRPITTATDIYSLGVLLYVLLASRHPTAWAGRSAADYVRAIMDTEPQRLSDAVTEAHAADPANGEIAGNRGVTPQGLRRALRGDLDNIVAKALKKDAGERYQTVTDFAQDLRCYLEHRPVGARPDSLVYRAAKFVRRNRSASAAALLAAIAIVAGLAGTATQARRAQHERDRAVHGLTYAEAANEFMRFLLSEGASKPFTTSELLARAAQTVERQFAGDADLRAHLQLTIGNEYADIRDFRQAEAMLLRSQAAARDAADPSLSAAIDCDLAGVYNAMGQYPRAAALFDEVQLRLRSAPDLERSAAANCFARLAVFYRDQGDAGQAITNAQAALDRLGAPRPGQLAQVVGFREVLADAYGILGQCFEAVRIYEVAIQDLARMGRDNTALQLQLELHYGMHLSMAGQTLRAAEVYRQALDSAAASGRIADRYLEADYGRLLVALGRYPEATVLIERTLAQAVAADNLRAVAAATLTAASAWCAAGDVQRCAAFLHDANAMMPSIYPQNGRVFANLELVSAQLALARRSPATGRERLQRALEFFAGGPADEPARIRALSLLARTELQLGDRRAAADHAAQAVAAARQGMRGFPYAEWLGTALLAQGMVQRDSGATAAAQATLREALVQLQGAMGDNAPPTSRARALLAEIT